MTDISGLQLPCVMPCVPCSVSSGSKPPSTVANGRYQIEKKLGAGSDLRSCSKCENVTVQKRTPFPLYCSIMFYLFSCLLVRASHLKFWVLRLLWRGFGWDTLDSVQQIARVFSWQTQQVVQVWQGRDKQTNEKVAVKFEDINIHCTSMIHPLYVHIHPHTIIRYIPCTFNMQILHVELLSRSQFEFEFRIHRDMHSNWSMSSMSWSAGLRFGFIGWNQWKISGKSLESH